MIKKIFKCVAIVIGMVALQSCDKGPDYGKMSPSMMDIAGAKSIGFINETAASRGEALSSGLYKIDANGNISAVAVYFTEDEYGNQTQHQDEVKMKSADIYNVGTDYLFFNDCMFVDKKGEHIYALPYKILVRKSDGKMWSLDYDDTGVWFGGHLEEGQYYQAYDGTLYYSEIHGGYLENIYKLNLKTEPATVEQVTANVEIKLPFAVDSKGVICGPVNSPDSYWWRGTFAWQNSGFQKVKLERSDFPYIRDYSDIVEGLEVSSYSSILPCIVDFRGQFYSVCGLVPDLRLNRKDVNLSDYPFVELGVCNKISIGDTPGSAKIDDSETINIKNDIGSDNGYKLESVMTTDEYILTSGYTNNYPRKPWITALNPETKTWKWVTETPDLIRFDKTVNYNNRYWVVTTIDENLGAWWIDIKTLEIGFVKFNEEIPSYMDKSIYDFADGKLIYSGVNPADSHQVKIAFDLMTGNAVTNDNAPVYKFSTLVTLN
ncbi:MAG: hypothetical protein K2K27_07740 [Muribaculaceae bacterium]|nr:hypothetical protein [Muribaculaceae bacterium]